MLVRYGVDMMTGIYYDQYYPNTKADSNKVVMPTNINNEPNLCKKKVLNTCANTVPLPSRCDDDDDDMSDTCVSRLCTLKMVRS